MEPVAGATRRFLTTAAIRVQRDDIVLVDSAGRERWLPLAGPHAVTESAAVPDGLVVGPAQAPPVRG